MPIWGHLKWTVIIFSRVLTRGRVLEDVLGLEDTFWSLRPWPRSFESLKIALSSARGQHYFLNHWNFVGKRQKPCGKLAKTFFCFPQLEIAWKKFLRRFSHEKKFWRPFFVGDLLKNFFEDLFFWRTLAPVSLALASSIPVFGLERVCPWPRIFLSSLPQALCPWLHLWFWRLELRARDRAPSNIRRMHVASIYLRAVYTVNLFFFFILLFASY